MLLKKNLLARDLLRPRTAANFGTDYVFSTASISNGSPKVRYLEGLTVESVESDLPLFYGINLEYYLISQLVHIIIMQYQTPTTNLLRVETSTAAKSCHN